MVYLNIANKYELRQCSSGAPSTLNLIGANIKVIVSMDAHTKCYEHVFCVHYEKMGDIDRERERANK